MDLVVDTETTFKASGSFRRHQFHPSSRQHCWLVCVAICMGTNLSQLLCNHPLLFRTRGLPHSSSAGSEIVRLTVEEQRARDRGGSIPHERQGGT